MPSNDTAALVVALSAQLTKFEKDMQGAVNIADKQSRAIETRFAALNKEIGNQFSVLSANATGNIGAVGSIMARLGPIGLAAAVGIGASVGAIVALVSAANEFATKSKALVEASETAGLTITQFKLLGQQGKQVGLDFDETAAFFTKYIANLEALRGGSGPLYDALLKIDVGLLRQLSVTKDSAQAIDLLVAAFARLGDQTKKLDLARAAGGRAGLTGVRLLDSLAGQGGLSGVESKSGPIDEGQIERARQLKTEIEDIKRKADNLWGGLFSDVILEQQKKSVQLWLDLSTWIADVVGKITNLRDTINSIGTTSGPAPLSVTVNKATAAADVPLPPSRPEGAGSPSVELQILQKNLALLGDAVTQGEQWKQKRLEIAAAAEKGGLMDGVAQRALAAFNIAQQAAALAARERLAIATEQQISDVKLAQLAQDRVKFKLSDADVDKARVVILREAKDAADALTVRQAYLPGLKQLQLDAQNVRKGLDTLATNSLNNLESALVDVVSGTKSASDAFRAMANAILSDLTRLALRQAIIGPLAGLLGLGSGGGTGSPGLFNVFGAGGFSPTGARAAGGPVAAGQTYMVGENGPEMFVPQTPGTIIPNGGGGTTINLNSTYKLDGAIGEDKLSAMIRTSHAQAVQQAVAITSAGAPARQQRYNQLGT